MFKNPLVAGAVGALILYVAIVIFSGNWNPFKKSL